jgi:hypothetical protein
VAAEASRDREEKDGHGESRPGRNGAGPVPVTNQGSTALVSGVPPAAIEEAAAGLTAWMLKYDWMTGLSQDQVRRVCEDVVGRVLETAGPVLESHIRAQIAASLRRAAEGRREYASGLGPGAEDTRDRLLLAAACHESSAGIIEDPRNLTDAVPAWMWPEGETASPHDREDQDRG